MSFGLKPFIIGLITDIANSPLLVNVDNSVYPTNTMYMYGIPSESGNIGLRVGDTVTYYDGFVLPALPEWDKETYLYAAMSVSFDSDGNPRSAYLALMPREGVLLSTGEGMPLALHLSVGETYLSSSWYSYNSNEFKFSEPKETTLTNAAQQGRIMNANTLKWTNYDIIDSTTGKLFLAESDPIPVSGIVDYDGDIPIYG